MKFLWRALAVPLAAIAAAGMALFPHTARGAEEEGEKPAGSAPEKVLTFDGHLKYRVKVVTEVVVPKDVKKYEMERLRLSHAIPTSRPWSESGGAEGASDISFLPESGVVEHSAEFDSHQVVWEVTRGLEPRAEFEFETEFTVISCERRFDARDAETSWEAFKGKVVETSNEEKAEEVPKILVDFAQKTRKRWAPHEAVLEFCKWIEGEMEYNVRLDHENIESILKRHGGHSVHYVTLLRALCQAAGIPMRQVQGLRLTEEDGVDEELIGFRQEFSNVHTWAEVFFPEYGWVEVDPSRAPDFFEIPVSYVQNNRWFRTQAIQVIAVAPGGARVELPLLRWERGGWVSYFVEANTITFEEKRHKVAKKGAAQKESETEESSMLPKALRAEREWTDVEGRKMRAALLRFADEAKRVLVLRRNDGREFEFPVEGLSEKDRGFLADALGGEEK